jgi:hypothetical protein
MPDSVTIARAQDARDYTPVASPPRNHLNCGTVGTVMRGGGIGATLDAFPIPLGSTDIFSSAPRVAGFGRTPPECPMPAEPPPRASDAVGKAKTMKKAKATFIEVFDMGKLH